MSLVLFSWCVQQRYFKDLMDQDIRLKLYAEKMKNIEEEITPFGFFDDGQKQTETFTDTDGTVWVTDPSESRSVLL